MDVMELIPPDISPWVAGALVLLSFATSFVSATAGIGGGVIVIAVFATLLPAAAVIPVQAAVQVGSNGGRAFMMRAHTNWTVIAGFIVGAVIGIWLGASMYVALEPAILRGLIGLFVLYSVWGPKMSKFHIPNWGYIPVGLATSFVSMFVGGTGPFVAAFISPGRFGKAAMIATHSFCMAFQHLLKIPAFLLLGFSFGPWLGLIAAMILTGLLGTYVGRSVLMKMPEKTFKILFSTVLTLLALRLLWSAYIEWV